MRTFDLHILGCGSALPTLKRNPTSHCLNISDRLYLIDCGEGTQVRLRNLKIRFQRINHIFISHLHGDHYFGLPGLISSMHLLGRENDLNIYGPPGLEGVIMRMLELSKTYLKYRINFHVTQFDGLHVLLETKNLKVSSFPLKHRIDCAGFIFEEIKEERKIIKPKIISHELKIAEIVLLKKGKDIVREDGSKLKNKDFTMDPPKVRSYAFCSDTKYTKSILPYIKDVTVLYHEATFLEELKERARETFHSTTKDAASIALEANAGSLIIGHYSSRYNDLKPFLKEAKEVFTHTFLAEEGKTYEINNSPSEVLKK